MHDQGRCGGRGIYGGTGLSETRPGDLNRGGDVRPGYLQARRRFRRERAAADACAVAEDRRRVIARGDRQYSGSTSADSTGSAGAAVGFRSTTAAGSPGAPGITIGRSKLLPVLRQRRPVSNQATAFDDKQRALLDRISLYLSSIQTMVGNFVQIGPDGGRTEGTFYIQKPGRMRFAYNPPSPIDIISDGSSVVVRDRKLATQDLYPLSQTPLRYLLADRIDLLRDTDVVSVTSDDTFDSVTIEQKQVMIGTDRLMIMFDAKDLTLKQWTVTDPQGLRHHGRGL